MDATRIRIAIIGAGPVGCMLARLLQLANVPYTVFEADASPNYRSQGGTLDLRTDTGLAALKDAGLFDEFEKLARYDGESMFITDKDLNVQLQLDPSPAGSGRGGRRPEIDRSELRRLLTESLSADTIRWGHRLVRVDEAADGEQGGRRLQLVFEHMTVGGYDLVVDGCRRGLEQDAGVPGRRAARICRPRHVRHVGPGPGGAHAGAARAQPAREHLCLRRGPASLGAQMGGLGELHVAVTFRVTDEAWIGEERRLARPLAQVKELLLGSGDTGGGTFGDYHPLLRDAVDKAQGGCTSRALYALPVGFRWEHRPGVTLVGDAAHVMTPYAGEGVNVGLEDARRDPARRRLARDY
ncbi:hypothetical protein RB601_008782 [Gaeumannomyces tritici]